MNTAESASQNPLDKPYTVALYRSLQYGVVIISEYCGPTEARPNRDTEVHNGYVRLSEPIEIRFNSLQNEEVIRNAIATCDAMELKVRLKFEDELKAIRDQKSQLLALTYSPEVKS
jgi:hypothetical protein